MTELDTSAAAAAGAAAAVSDATAAAADPAAASAASSSQTAPAADPTAASATAGQGDAAAAAAAATTTNPWPEKGWPEDWKARIAKSFEADPAKLAKISEYVGKRASLDDIIVSAVSAQEKINQLALEAKGRVKVPGKDATPEDVKAFRDALGVPEAPDKYVRPEGMAAPEGVEALLETKLFEVLHSTNASQATAQGILSLVPRMQEVAELARNEQAKAIGERTAENLHVAYGKDFDANVALADRFLRNSITPYLPQGDTLESFLGKRMEDGTRLGDYEPFVRAMVAVAKENFDDDVLPSGESAAGMDVKGRIDEIMLMVTKDPKGYNAAQAELKKLIEIDSRSKTR